MRSQSYDAAMVVEPPVTKRSRRTRAELARAVHDEVAQRGTLDVAAITTSADVSPATFYAHFATHDDALAAALDLTLIAVVGVSERQFTIEALLDRGVGQVVAGLVDDVVATFRREALVMRAALARLPRHRGIREVYRHHEGVARAHLTRHVELGQRAGLLRPGDPEARAVTLLVLTQGLNNPLLTADDRVGMVVDDLRHAIMAVLAA